MDILCLPAAPSRHRPKCSLSSALNRSALRVSDATGKPVSEVTSQIASRVLELYQEELSTISKVRSLAEAQGLTLAEFLNERLAA